MNLVFEDYEKIIRMAFEEDLNGIGDITTDAVNSVNVKGIAKLVAKETGVICGCQVFKDCFYYLDKLIDIEFLKNDGEEVVKGEVFCYIKGDLSVILKAERTALNFMQRMSGISTKTLRMVETINTYLPKTKLLDTRKTLPGYRALDKYAVFCGKGTNHRMGLYDLFMIKDNHIDFAGSIKEAVERVRSFKKIKKLNQKIEVEIKDFEEFKIAHDLNVDIIMLDNMSYAEMQKCIDYNINKIALEISGNITEEKLQGLKGLEIDFISSGALTHSANALDISMIVDKA